MSESDGEVVMRELVRMLYGEYADEEAQSDKRLERWAEAFDEWLEARRTRFSSNIGKDSQHAWSEFLAFTRKAPWDIQVEDVEAYIKALKGKGLRAGTIHKRMTGLKKFYEHCQEKGIDAQCEAGFNPAAKARRPKVISYEKANYLSLEEERALLKVIKNDPSVLGKRDYALFSLLLRTGCRAGEARCLRWGDIEFEGGRGRSWGAGGQGEELGSRGARGQGSTGGGGRRIALPEEVWEVIRFYLEAAGRIDTIQPEEYVFAPSKEALVREAGGEADDWAAERPLSMDQLHYLLKLYAGWAGLKAEEITCHTLRHTAVMRLDEEAEEEEAVVARLGRRSASKTKEYLEWMRKKPTGQLRRRKGGIWKEGQAPPRGPCRTKLRNHLALRHGLSAKYLPELEWMDEQGMQLRGLERELVRWRVVVRRAAMLSKEAETQKEALELLEAGGTAAVRVGKVLKYMHESKEAAEAATKAEWDEAVAEELEKVLEEEWPSGLRRYLPSIVAIPLFPKR